MKRTAVFFSLLLFSLSTALDPVWAMQGPNGAPSRPLRLIVTFNPSYIPTLEGSLSAASLETNSAAATGSVRTFLRQRRIRRLEPVFKDLVGEKKRTGKTGLQLAEETRQRFPRRSRRLRGPSAPPDLSLHYVATPEIQTPEALAALAAELRQDPNVSAVEPEAVYHLQFVPNDPYYSTRGTWGQTYDDLYGLKLMSLTNAWDLSTGAGTIVAVVDSGIDYTHPDLAPNVWVDPVTGVQARDFVNGDNDPMDDYGHGTHIAGTIAAAGNNSLGVIGVAWKTRIMGVKSFDSFGHADATTVSNGIVWAVDHGADVINMSFGGETGSVSDTALQYADSQGVVLVVAAGNDSTDLEEAIKNVPAISPLVITVSALDWNDHLAAFSNFGNKIDVGAPGVEILSIKAAGTTGGTDVAPGYIRANGTSMAAPHVAGAAALILSQHPDYTNDQVRLALRLSADDVGPPGFDPQSGYGRVNAWRALQLGPLPLLRISYPLPSSFPEENTVVVRGSASGPGFMSYELAYSSGGDFTLIQSSTSPVTGGILGRWNKTALPAGRYSLRLKVVTASQTFTYNVEPVWIDRLAPTVTLLRPREGDTFVANAEILVTMEASDDTQIKKAFMSADSIGFAEFSAPPYAASLFLPAGTHSVLGGATDIRGRSTSRFVNVNVVADTVSPNPPVVVNVVPVFPPGMLKVSWSGASDNARVTGYRFDLSTHPQFATYVFGWQDRDVGNVTQVDISGPLLNQTTYYARVRAYDGAGGISVNSVTGQGVTPAAGPDVQPPTPPGGINLGHSTTSTLLLTWNPSADNVGVAGYRLDLSTNYLFTSFVAGYNNFNAGNVTSFRLNGLVSGSTYYARIRAFDAAGNTSPNVFAQANTLSVSARPVSFWSFDEASGPALDGSGNGNTGTLSSGASRTAGKIGNALLLTGTNEVTVADSNTLSFGNGSQDQPFSVALWVNFDTNGAGNFIGHFQAPNNREWRLGRLSDGRVYLILYDESSDSQIATATTKNTWTIGTWYHIAATYSGGGSGGGVNLFVNGVFDATGNPGDPGYVGLENLSAPIEIGGFNGGGGFVGKLDEIYVYNKGIALAEILELYNAPSPNHAPLVSAGADQTITLPQTVSLSGNAVDDGLPIPPVGLTYLWNKLSGPGNVVFSSRSARQTTASFSSSGIYALQLMASDGALSGSSIVTITVNPNGPPPPPPQSPAIVAPVSSQWLGDLVTIRGAANGPGFTSYELAYSTGGDFTVISTSTSSVTDGTLGIWDTGTLAGGIYSLRLRVITTSQVFTAIVTSLFIDRSPPRVGLITPTQGATFLSGSQVLVTPDILDDTQLVQRVEFSMDGNSSFDNVPPFSESFIVTNTTVGHDLAATATDISGKSSTAVVHVNVSQDNVPPNPPTVVSVAHVFPPGVLQVSWSGASDNTGVAGYLFDLSTHPQFASYVAGWQNVDVGDITQLNVNGPLLSQTTYYARVRAYDRAGNISANSVTGQGTSTDGQAPTSPGSPALSQPTTSTLLFSWNASTDNVAVAGYRFDVSTSASFTGFAAGYNNFNAGNTTSFSLTGLVAGTTYYARVRAFDAAGNSSSNSQAAQGSTSSSGPGPAPIASWSFDEASGPALDSSGNGNTGTLTGGASRAAGKIGNALQFTGTNEVTVPDANSLTFNNGTQDQPFSIALWMNFNTTGPGNLIGHFQAPNNREWRLGRIDDGRIYMMLYDEVTDGQISRGTSQNTWTVGAWHHIAVTYDGSGDGNNVKFYVNGVFHPQIESDLPGYIRMRNLSAPLEIGGFNGGGNFAGKLDDVRLYNSVLTAADVLQVFNGGGAPPPPPVNQKPTVSAGANQTVTLPAAASLQGTASDDGLPNPPAALTYTWSKVSGPGNVVFGSASSLTTSAAFSVDGTYVLSLTASDSVLSDSSSITVTVNPSGPPPVGPAPIAYWSFDEASGPALDSSGNGNTGTLTSGAGRTAGRVGNALQLTGTNEVTVPDANSLSFGNGSQDQPFSVALWVNFDTNAAGNFIGHFQATANREWRLGRLSDGRVHFILYDESSDGQIARATAQNMWTTGAWYHIAATYDGSRNGSGMKFYVNGVSNSQGANGDNPGYVALENLSAPLEIGGFNGGGNLVGKLDEVRLYNTVLSPADVQQLFNGGGAPPPPPVNQMPAVSAGANQSITLPASASLQGTASDDGLPNPPAALTYTWSKVSGPGNVTFGSAFTLATSASFSVDGTYVLSFTASDSLLSNSSSITITVNPTGPPLGPAPMAYWSFDEASGAALDSSGNGHTGTLTSGAGRTAGKIGNALQLTGTNEVTVPDANSLSFGNGSQDQPFSIALWVNFDTNGAGNFIGHFLARANREWRLGRLSDGRVHFILYDESSDGQIARATAQNTWTTGVWYHIAATYDGSRNGNGMKFYVNGVAHSQGATGDNPGYVALENLSAPLEIGGFNGVGGFVGKLDEVRLYNTVLTSADVQQLLNAQ